MTGFGMTPGLQYLGRIHPPLAYPKGSKAEGRGKWGYKYDPRILGSVTSSPYSCRVSVTMDNITSDISAANGSLEANDQKQSKRESSVHLESVNSTPPTDLDDENDPKRTSPYIWCDPKDPQNWPEWKKNAQILMVSFHSLSSTFMAAGIVPASHTFSEEYGISLSKASYLVSAQVWPLSAVMPLI